MSLDPSKLILNSDVSYLKLWQEGEGSVTIPAIPAFGGTLIGTTTIAHTYGSDNIICQVGFISGTDYYFSPFIAPNGGFFVLPYWDENNIYIEAGDDNSGSSSQPARTLDFIYRILVP